jgi:hypothetical protein
VRARARQAGRARGGVRPLGGTPRGHRRGHGHAAPARLRRRRARGGHARGGAR